MQNFEKSHIDVALVRRLIDSQFPQWAQLKVSPIEFGGWDNKTFHLGEQMLVRMPSAEAYAAKVEKEQKWLPKLAPLLRLQIPEPLAMGKPGEGYPWNWSVYRWIEGETAARGHIADHCHFAQSLGQFLRALQSIDAKNGPEPGAHNFYRGGSLAVYDGETRKAIAALKGKIDEGAATELWEKALRTTWQNSPVWVHGDISTGNLLVKDGQLCAVIDFGGLSIGDPACDLAIAWTMFNTASRKAFRETLQLDEDTWIRGQAWTLWKATITAAGFTNPNNTESEQCWRIIDDVLAEEIF